MRTGLVVTAQPGVENLAAHAEELGLGSSRVYSPPMANWRPSVPRLA